MYAELGVIFQTRNARICCLTEAGYRTKHSIFGDNQYIGCEVQPRQLRCGCVSGRNAASHSGNGQTSFTEAVSNRWNSVEPAAIQGHFEDSHPRSEAPDSRDVSFG